MKQLIILAAAALLLAIVSHVKAESLAWEPSVVNESQGEPDGYIVEMAPAVEEGAELVWSYRYTVTDGTTLPLDDKIPYGQTFHFRVSAYNAAGVSAPCPSISWTRPGFTPPEDVTLPPVVVIDSTPPSPPTGLIAE